MEAQFGGKLGHVYGPILADLNPEGKRSLEWDLNDWRWDGDLFLATQFNSIPSDCRSRQFFPARTETSLTITTPNYSLPIFDDLNTNNDGGKKELEKRRRVVVVPNEELNDEVGTLDLNLGGQAYPIADEEAEKREGTSGKKTKLSGSSPTHPVCQVEDCRADLSNAKDYHRRHKVCDMHSKASQALVGNVMQRFCQQCSRFHVLQEFDEGKRSCRRRLAGHNKRRRKMHPETSVNNLGSLNDEQGSSYLLITLLRILSNLQASSADQKKDQDLLSHLLKNLASLAGAVNDSSRSGLVQRYQDSQDAGASPGAPQKDLPRADQQREPAASIEKHKGVLTNHVLRGMQQAASGMCQRINLTSDVPVQENRTETTEKRNKLANIDLNNEYDGSQDFLDNQDKSHGSLDCLVSVQDMHKTSPPHTSGNSDSTFARSPSSSSGSEVQSRTDRIVFKLFGKDPNDLPHLLRSQILDWLSHSPTDIEGYIRPGCIVLTIYLRLDKSLWDELCYNLGFSLSRLLNLSDDPFWRTGWIYTGVQNRVAFIYNGEVVLDTPFPSKNCRTCQISSISPLAVSASQTVQFVIRGTNLSRSTSRFLCALEGKYLAQDRLNSLLEDDNSIIQQDDIPRVRINCSIPNVTGRGFIEVEDCGLSRSFFPFIVAEPDVCAEICTLENVIEVAETADETEGKYERIDARNQALDFLHEIGWLLHRNGLRIGSSDASTLPDRFPFERVKCLLDFSLNHDWCAVVKKLLDILLNGTVDSDTHPSVEHALSEMGLLHRAVQRNSRPMVESLLRYIPESVAHRSDGSQPDSNVEKQRFSKGGFLFRPDAAGPGGLTPLHIAASSEGCEKVLEALIQDPGMVGIGAWRSARDSTGLTPNEYACLRGHYSYVHLVQRKTNKSPSPPGPGHAVVDIPAAVSVSFSGGGCNPNKLNQAGIFKPKSSVGTFQVEKSGAKPPLMGSSSSSCKRCEKKLDYYYGYTRTAALTYRPAMLSMLAIAAVCVCAALLFKSNPKVYIYKPFSWESLEYGAM
ncbi:hypothetical protein Dimus_000606 [Dionaea muscipula]